MRKQEILQWVAKKDKIQKLLEGFLRKVAQYDKNLCVVLGRDPKIPIYGGCNMLQEFLRKVAKMDKPMGVKYVARVFTQGGKNGQNLWRCSILRMMAKNDKIIGWIRQHKI